MLRDGSVVSQQVKWCLGCPVVFPPLPVIDSNFTLGRCILMGAAAEESNDMMECFAGSANIVTEALVTRLVLKIISGFSVSCLWHNFFFSERAYLFSPISFLLFASPLT